MRGATTLIRGAIAVCIGLAAVLATFFFGRAALVHGGSMAPTLTTGEVVLVESASYRLRPPQRGDIVVVHLDTQQWLFAEMAGGRFVKRIVGLPGETVEVRGEQVLVDGRVLDEPYVHSHPTQSLPPVVVPQGAYYVMGDNRLGSDDSRVWGPVRQAAIVGHAWVAAWPLPLARLL
jgi:signal peptidase I